MLHSLLLLISFRLQWSTSAWDADPSLCFAVSSPGFKSTIFSLIKSSNIYYCYYFSRVLNCAMQIVQFLLLCKRIVAFLSPVVSSAWSSSALQTGTLLAEKTIQRLQDLLSIQYMEFSLFYHCLYCMLSLLFAPLQVDKPLQQRYLATYITFTDSHTTVHCRLILLLFG